MIQQAKLNRAFFAKYGEPSQAKPSFLEGMASRAEPSFFPKSSSKNRAEPSFGSDPTLLSRLNLLGKVLITNLQIYNSVFVVFSGMFSCLFLALQTEWKSFLLQKYISILKTLTHKEFRTLTCKDF